MKAFDMKKCIFRSVGLVLREEERISSFFVTFISNT